MTTSTRVGASAADTAGALLRYWREIRGKSQLDLAMDAGVSQKHISFVETGRSQPTSRMVIDLADALDVPLRERNAILLAAGYAPRYSEANIDTPPLARLTAALHRMLRQNEPFPAIVMDRHWSVILANEAASKFFGCFTALSTRSVPRNLLHLVFDPAGLRPFVQDWPTTSRMLLARVRRESLGQIIDPGTRLLLDELGRYPDVDPLPRETEPDATSPLIPLTFSKDGIVLSYFSLVTTVGTPLAVTAQELRLECMIPADDSTENAHADFVSRHATVL